MWPGGTHLKRGTGMCGPQDPLFTPLLPFTRPPVEAQVHSKDPHLKEKCDISPPKQTFFRKYDNFQLQNLKFDNNVCQKAWKFCKISILKPLFSMKICSHAPTFMAIYPLTSPQVRKSRPHLPTRKNVECLPSACVWKISDFLSLTCDIWHLF